MVHGGKQCVQLTLDWSIKKELVALDATFCRVLLSYWQGFNLKYPKLY